MIKVKTESNPGIDCPQTPVKLGLNKLGEMKIHQRSHKTNKRILITQVSDVK